MGRQREIEAELERLRNPLKYEGKNGTAYEFNKETGTLRLSMSPSDVENFLQDYSLPKSLTLPTLEGPTFERVKRIESIPSGNGRYAFGYKN